MKELKLRNLHQSQKQVFAKATAGYYRIMKSPLLSSELRNLWIINSWSGPPKTFQHPPNSLRVCICSRKTNPLEKEWNPPSTSQDVLDVALSETWLPRTELVARVVHHMFQIAKNLGVNPQFSDTQISSCCQCNVSHSCPIKWDIKCPHLYWLL